MNGIRTTKLSCAGLFAAGRCFVLSHWFPKNPSIIQLVVLPIVLLGIFTNSNSTMAQSGQAEYTRPERQEIVHPIRNNSFNKNGKCRIRKQGGNPRNRDDVLVFDGATDGNRQVDPQIAVGGNHVLHATNNGLIIYNKKGEFVQGVSQRCFNNGIDPKLFFDPHNKVFGFDLWNPWDKEKQKPVNISVSESHDPTGAWNTYPVPAPEGRDGGGIGFSKHWIGYSFPGGTCQSFVLKMSEAMRGQPATVYHFSGNLGHPVATQDNRNDLLFVKIRRRDIQIHSVQESKSGEPVVRRIVNIPHKFQHFGWPPPSPQKGTDKPTASGDRNPKNLVVQNGALWFSHTVNCQGRAAVQWHQIDLTTKKFVQSGLISDKKRSFIQTTIAVNKNNDVLVGYQETGPEMFISPRFAYRLADDPPNTLRQQRHLGEGQAPTEGGAWGDYSGSVVDGDNLTDLWTVQSIADSEGRGDTVIARLRLQK